MWDWDWSSPWLYVGAACILAAIVGGGITAFGQKIPVINSVRRQALLAIFGVVLILAPQLVKWAKEQEIQSDKLQVEKVEASLDRQTYWPEKPGEGCNVHMLVTATVVMRGKNGTVDLALKAKWTEVHPELDPSQQKDYESESILPGLTADNGNPQTETVKLQFTVRPGAPSRTDYEMRVHLVTPVDKVSEPVRFSVQCDQGTS